MTRHHEDQREVALNDLVYRRTSPYYPDDAYTLIGEHLTLAYTGCRFVGFQRSDDRGERNFYTGISLADQNKCRPQLDEAMDAERTFPALTDVAVENSVRDMLARDAMAKTSALSRALRQFFKDRGLSLPGHLTVARTPSGTFFLCSDNKKHCALTFFGGRLTALPVIDVSFYRRECAVVCRRIVLTRDDFRECIDAVRKERYWEPLFLRRELAATFEKYATMLLSSAHKFVLFWRPEGDLAPLDTKLLVRAIVNAIPVRTAAQPDRRAHQLPIDDIDVMRWFTARFEATWHLQPNEQMGFLVLETPSHSARPSPMQDDTHRRAGEKLGFDGWLAYKYTGNLFITSPSHVVRFVDAIRSEVSAAAASNDTGDEDFRRAAAKRVVQRFLDDSFAKLHASAEPYDDVAMIGADAGDATQAVREARTRERLDAVEALKTMARHLNTALAKVDAHIASEKYDSYWLKPILRSETFDRARQVDVDSIERVVALCDERHNGSPTRANPVDPATTAASMAILFYVNLFFRRVLLEIPQTLEIGFAPYFMEVGFADPEVLIDGGNFEPRLDASMSQPWRRKNDAIYKLLGEIEQLFGIGGPPPWTFYMPAAPLFAHGQRRGFIFVAGYYNKAWEMKTGPAAAVRLQRRLMYLSRLLRANAYYAGRELQEAYNRRFRKEIATVLRESGATLEEGLVDNMHLLCNLREPVAMTRVESTVESQLIDVSSDILTLPLRSASEAPGAAMRRLRIPLLPGEIEGFVTSGLFPLVCTLSDADSLSSLKDKVSSDLRSFITTSRHNLANIVEKGLFPFGKGLQTQRTASASARWLYAQGESLVPLLQFSFYLLGDGAVDKRGTCPVLLPLVDGFRRAVNLYFAQHGLELHGSSTFAYSGATILRTADRAPWQLALTIDTPRVRTATPLRFADRSPMRDLVANDGPTADGGSEVYGLSKYTVDEVWRDVVVNRPSTFRSALSEVVGESRLGLGVMFQELMYNACKHGNGVEIQARLAMEQAGMVLTIRNACVPREPPAIDAKHGLATLETFAGFLGVKFAWDRAALRLGEFVATLEFAR
jgi:hypothetical protein